MKQKYLFDRYANSVIGSDPTDIDAIEVQGVRNDGDISVETDNDRPEFFSVYVHFAPDNKLGMEGLQCVGDFSNRADAQRYARELSGTYGWTVTDYTKDVTPERAWEVMDDRVLLDAAKLNDLNASVQLVAQYASITDLTIANSSLARYTGSWEGLTASLRVQALEMWRDAERLANKEYELPEPKNIEVTVLLAGLRTLQENLASVSEGVVDILGEDNISVETEEDRKSLAEFIDTLCERVNVNESEYSLALTNAIKALLPYAQSRAEDLYDTGAGTDAREAGNKAWEAVNAAHKLLGTTP